jgi:YD repeat-containing protein
MKVLLVLSAILSISSAFARADVSLRNGNFYVTFRDLSYPGGIEPKIERVYNSKSDFMGIFGYSWGTEYETQIKIDSDGSILVHEYGGGAENRFTSKGAKPEDVKKGVDQLVEAAKKSGVIATASQVSDYRSRLQNDMDFRSKQYGIYVAKGLVAKKTVVDGTQFTSIRYLYQYITKVKGGYVRVMEAGNIQKFNEAGKLVQIMDRNKNFVNFAYDKGNRLIQIVDSQNRKINLTYNTQGFVEKIAGESGKTAAYRYNKEGMLVYCKDDAGEENTFAYTGDAYRNLAEIGYLKDRDAKGQPRKMKISYYGPEKNTSVKSVINPDGTTNEYEYFKDPKNADYYSVRVLLKDGAGARISDAKYEYFSKNRPSGEVLTYKMISTVDGDRTETLYDDKSGLPVSVSNGGRLTKMEYDQKGRLIKKVTPVETTTLAYDPKVGKVSKVVRQLKSGTVFWSQFSYDSTTGNLTVAKNNEKKEVKLVHDQQGNIRALIDQSGRRLTFKYNESAKPIEIADEKLGVIKVSYKNSGEVDKIESNGGSSVAAEVMRALQGLLDITAPAGVSLGL